MSNIRVNWKIVFGWLAVLGAITAMLVTWMRSGNSGESPDSSSRVCKGILSTRGADGSTGQVVKPEAKGRKSRPLTETDLVADTRLRSLLADGDLNAIHDELTAMADARRLASVGKLLGIWCREGSLEIAQWCLVISGESDADLNLQLSAEALSNPSEVIRESAACHLEEVSGIRFENSRQASDWLESRPEH